MRILGLVGALVLAGCATAGPLASGPLADLSKFTTEDLTVALADAHAHNDQAGIMCWATLLQIVQSGATTGAPQIKGVASAIQAKRDLLGASGQGQDLKRAIVLGCSALANEEAATLAKFGIMGATGIPLIP